MFSTYLRRWVLEEGQVQPLNHRDGDSVGENHDVGYLLGNNVFHHLSEGLPRQNLLKMDLIYYFVSQKRSSSTTCKDKNAESVIYKYTFKIRSIHSHKVFAGKSNQLQNEMPILNDKM